MSDEPDHVVVEGRLVTTAGEDGLPEHRAFGEFESRHGELASYAFGWSSGRGADVGRVTVGIGAGNEGGGTFHARAWYDDGLSYGLVDEPFEDVPEGGPHLTAEEARAHEDLRFVWMVIDVVMDRDSRAGWFRHTLRLTPAIATPEVAGGDEAVLLVVHDAEDDEHGDLWQLIGTSDAGDEAAWQHVHHAVDRDPTLAEVLDLPPGWRAERDAPGRPWRRAPDEDAG